MTPRSDFEETTPASAVAESIRSPVTVTDVGGCSVQGSARVRNEDAWGFAHGAVFVVADGIGGRPDGDVAAHAAVDSLLTSLSNHVADWRDPMRRASEAVRRAPVPTGPTRVASRHDDRGGPSGAVAVALRCVHARTSIVHVGDARAFRVRDGMVEPLTRDHSVTEVMAGLGLRRSETGLPAHELAAVTSYFGDSRSWEEFTVRELTVRAGDRIVLCTDGCYRHVSRDAWRSAVANTSAGQVARLLVEHAVSAGATDDSTAMVIELDSTSP